MTTLSSLKQGKNAYYVTLGAVAFVEKKSSDWLDTLIKEGEKTDKELEKAVKKYRDRVETNTQDFKKSVEERYQKVVDNLKIDKQLAFVKDHTKELTDKVTALLSKAEKDTEAAETETTETEVASEAV